MGCDIHLHSEILIDNRWHHYNDIHVNRNYQLFAIMAGVRGDETPISIAKGFPIDASEITRIDYDYWDGDAHSASYLTSDELVILRSRLEEFEWEESDIFGYFFGNDYSGFKRYPEDSQIELIQDVRFVFWFDN